MDLDQFESPKEKTKERILVEPKPSNTKIGSGRPTYKEVGVKYIKVANDLKETTVQEMKIALATKYFGKKQAELVDDAIVFYLENNKSIR